MNNIIKRKWNQNSMVIIEDLQGMAFQAESGGHTFQISGIDGEGNAVALSGTPAGVMLRADGQDVTLTCSVSGGVVYATLPANAYVVPGRFGLTIFLTSDGQKTAIYAAVGTVGKTSSGTVAPPAGSDVVTLVNAIAAAVATIPASYTDLMAAMAPTYSSSGLYAVGSYAWYSGKLYRCTTAITSGETWTSGHWTLANLGSDLVDLKSALNDISVVENNVCSEANLIDYESITENKRISVSTGSISDATNQSISDYIPVCFGSTIILSFTFGSDSYGHAFYDADKNWISTISGNNAGKKFTINNKNVSYIRLTIPKTELVEDSETAIATIHTPWNNAYKDIKPIITNFISERNIIDYSKITKNKRIYVASDLIDDHNDYSISDFIPVVYGSVINTNFSVGSNSWGHGFYDINKQWVSSISGNSAGEKFIIYNTTIAYVRLTIPNTELVEGSETATAIITTNENIAVKTSINGIRNILPNAFEAKNIINYSTMTASKRIKVSDMSIVDATNQSLSDYIPVISGQKIKVNFQIESATYGHGFYDEDKNPISAIDCNTVRFANDTFTVPSGAYFVRFSVPKTALVSGSETAFAYYIVEPSPIVKKTKWLAVGDSITKGVYSYMSGGSATSGETEYSWVKLLADSYNYDLTIMASRGMGYVRTGKDPNGGDTRIDIDELLTRIEALDIEVNLITMAFGVNDYNSTVDNDSNPTKYVTLQNIKDSFDDAVQRLMAKFPEARLVVITPFNCCNHGNAGTNYGYNQVVPSATPSDPNVEQKTLKQVADAIKERCVAFGVECVYASNGFLFNNYNIQTLQPDEVHPSLKGHTLIAKNMIHYLIN